MVKVYYENDGMHQRISMTGHADYIKGGNDEDPVCSACSAILWSLYAWIENSDTHVYSVERCKITEGDCRIDASGDEYLYNAYMMAVLGLAAIAESYPQNVCVETD